MPRREDTGLRMDLEAALEHLSDTARAVVWLHDVEGYTHDEIATMENSQLPALINSCQIFIMPSLYEVHPKALIEAMACGIPVVGTAVPGITELITHGQNGLVCSPDRESLREAMQKLLFDEELQKRLGENARKFSVEYFSLSRIIELEIATISSVVDQYGRH